MVDRCHPPKFGVKMDLTDGRTRHDSITSVIFLMNQNPRVLQIIQLMSPESMKSGFLVNK